MAKAQNEFIKEKEEIYTYKILYGKLRQDYMTMSTDIG